MPLSSEEIRQRWLPVDSEPTEILTLNVRAIRLRLWVCDRQGNFTAIILLKAGTLSLLNDSSS